MHVTTYKMFLKCLTLKRRLKKIFANVVQMFSFTCNHRLSSTCVQHAKTFTKMFRNVFCKCFSVKHLKTFLAVVTGKTRNQCCRKETARFKVRRQHLLQV